MDLGDFVERLIQGPLSDRGALRLVSPQAGASGLRHGFHSHDAWELFCPLSGALYFEAAGAELEKVPAGQILIVPPACLHMGVDRLPQPKTLELAVVSFPGEDANYGAVRAGAVEGGRRFALSSLELETWTERLGEPPAAVMGRVAKSLVEGRWGRERAAGWLRVLFAAFAEVAGRGGAEPLRAGNRRVGEALAFLQTRYYEPGLSVADVAAAVGVSASHLSSLFRAATGQTVHQALVDIRMRRAWALLEAGSHTIKEIAALTGWSNQHYFSAAFRKSHGSPQTAIR